MNLKGFMIAILTTAGGVVALGADFPTIDKLPSHPEFPDPLVMLNGTRITTKEEWRQKRRPELKKLFEHYMYGYLPPPPEKIGFHVDRVDPKALNGKATLKQITISFGPAGTPKTRVLLYIPNKRQGPAPVFLGLNFYGNHTVVTDPSIPLPTAWVPKNAKGVKENHATDEGRGSQADAWAIEQTIDRGYAVATAYCGDIDPDRADKREGIQPHLRPAGTQPGPHDWGTIAAWAWGLERVVDYLVTDPDIDARRIVIVGHSRLGKAAMLAAAFDERVAIGIPLQAGCGGTAPSRSTVGESVQRINTSFPHWFDGAFKEFNEKTDRLPFDQHCLIALMAPRPVLLPNAVEDTWANPAGQFEMLKAAEPVYRLLGAEGLASKQMPAQGKLMDSTLGYYLRAGKHAMTADDWRVFAAYADKNLTVAGTKAAAQAPKDKAGWKKLFDGKSMAGWTKAQFGGEGDVTIENGALLMEQGEDMTGVTYDKGDFPKMNYEVTLEGKRIKGFDFFCTTTFPVGDDHCSLVLGGWGGTVVGISSLDEKDASSNETSTQADFKKDQWYRVKIRVTKDRIAAWIDDKQVIDADTKGRKISIRPECDLCKPFGFATWRTTGAVRDVRVRTLSAEEAKK